MKCKCKCKCCKPDQPTWEDVIAELRDARIDRKVQGSIVLSDDEWRVYRDGLIPTARHRDPELYEIGIDNLMYQGTPVISATEYGNWKARKRNHVTP